VKKVTILIIFAERSYKREIQPGAGVFIIVLRRWKKEASALCDSRLGAGKGGV